MLEYRKEKRKPTLPIWENDAINVYHWWMEDGVIPGQTSLYDEDDEN